MTASANEALAKSGVKRMRYGPWGSLAALFAARTCLGFQFASVAAVAPFLGPGLGIGHAEVGILTGLFMIPGVPAALFGAALSRRLGDGRLCRAGLCCMAVGGILFALAPSYAATILARLVGGIGFVFANVAFTGIVADWFAAGRLATAMSVMLASWPFGIAIAVACLTPIAAAAGWSTAVLASALPCGVAIIVMKLACGADRPAAAGACSPASDPLCRRLTWPDGAAAGAAGLIWGIFNLGLVIFFSFEPAHLAGEGRPFAEAASLASVALWISIGSLPLGGYLVERARCTDMAVVIAAAALGMAVFLLRYEPNAAWLCSFIGVAIGFPAGALIALPGQVLPPAVRAPGIGVFYAVYYAVMTVGPVVAGLVRDLCANDAPVLALGAASFWSIPPLYLFLRRMTGLPLRYALAGCGPKVWD